MGLAPPVIEHTRCGDLGCDAPPPPPLASQWSDGAIYLGSFSKVLAPGLRLGYIVAPKPLYPKLQEAKQAADLHTPRFNQRIVHEVVHAGLPLRTVPEIAPRHKLPRDPMRRALGHPI